MMGPASFVVRLLKCKGFIPVLFSQNDFDSSLSLKEQFIHIKTKLEDAAIGLESIS
ncbi:unnamed protein product [Gongylonema pulchrum]|uniref:Uncharacterized protein n=1 Tax=Gongylonema pulchrum TaxID=637853 RepID=A0A3P7NV45_9BILA|nr:unnamed protein product [Gongylonema pulchrum]